MGGEVEVTGGGGEEKTEWGKGEERVLGKIALGIGPSGTRTARDRARSIQDRECTLLSVGGEARAQKVITQEPIKEEAEREGTRQRALLEISVHVSSKEG